MKTIKHRKKERNRETMKDKNNKTQKERKKERNGETMKD